MSRCRSCNAEIIWARTESGKAMPLDAEPTEDGNVKIVGGFAVVGGLQLLDPGPRYTSHFATCPNAAQHRRPA
jgi:hypothetical protein